MKFIEALTYLELGEKFIINNKRFPLNSFIELSLTSNVSTIKDFYVVDITTQLPLLYRLSYEDINSEWTIV